MWFVRRKNNFEAIFWALGGQSEHSLGPDSVAQLQAMRDLVTPATLAFERKGDLEAQGEGEAELARRSFGFLAVYCARRHSHHRFITTPMFCNRLRNVQGGRVGG